MRSRMARPLHLGQHIGRLVQLRGAQGGTAGAGGQGCCEGEGVLGAASCVGAAGEGGGGAGDAGQGRGCGEHFGYCLWVMWLLGVVEGLELKLVQLSVWVVWCFCGVDDSAPNPIVQRVYSNVLIEDCR